MNSRPEDEVCPSSIPPVVAPHAWVAVRSRPRCEKKILRFANEQGWPCYLPLRERVHQYGSRRRAFSSPLFPGYMFAAIKPHDMRILRQNQYVSRVLTTADQEDLDRQLRSLESALARHAIADVLPFIQAGNLVRVTAGPMRGVEGVVQRVKGKTRVVLNIDMIQQAVAIEIDSAVLGPA